MTPEYEYRGLMAHAWDLLRGDTSGWEDRAFFRTVIERDGGPALDVGCGAGRLLLDYLEAGLDVDGVDISPEMLALCRAKGEAAGRDMASRLHLGAMQALALPRRYRVIFVPSLSFQLLTRPGDPEQALAGFRAHLSPGGQLALSFLDCADSVGATDGAWSAWAIDAEATRDDGVVVRRWTRLRAHAATQLVDEVFRYELLRDGAVIRTEEHGHIPTLRWYTLEQAMALVSAAGFVDLAGFRESSFESASPDETRFKILAVRP